MQSDTNSVERGGVKLYQCQEKEVPECRSSLHPEKELLGWRSITKILLVAGIQDSCF